MQNTKKPGASVREDCMGKPGINCSSPYCSMNRERRSRSVSEVHEDILNISPRLSHHNPNIRLERRLHDRNSMCFPEMAARCNSLASTEIPLPKPAAELVKEIATLDLEVVHLERYLLSLYRTAFDQYLASSPTATSHASRSPMDRAGYQVQDATMQIEYQSSSAVNSSHMHEKMNQSQGLERTETKSSINYRHTGNSPVHGLAASSDKSCGPSPREDRIYDMPKSMSGRRSLADHLGASIPDHVPETPCKLSEDIVRCISAIYCKLANPTTEQIDILASPTPSVSSSSTVSPRDPSDSWSSGCHYDSAASPCQYDSLKDKQNAYSGMVEVPKITVDGDKFGYASKMLNIFRSLIRRLEKIDPRKMEHEEQLAFWINVHNALVMHAFLAYGLHQNHMKSSFSILKAAYDVGRHSVNAYVIQRSILGCQLHRPALGLRTLLSPIKFIKRSDKHAYTLDRPESLAHFALCLGAYSDPAVRVYTAKGISHELKLAKEEFIQANVLIHQETKIILPKILGYYAKDASLELSDLVEMVSDCMPEAQQKAIQGCLLRRKPEKCVEWSSYKSSFRYLVHRDLAKQ